MDVYMPPSVGKASPNTKLVEIRDWDFLVYVNFLLPLEA